MSALEAAAAPAANSTNSTNRLSVEGAGGCSTPTEEASDAAESRLAKDESKDSGDPMATAGGHGNDSNAEGASDAGKVWPGYFQVARVVVVGVITHAFLRSPEL